MDINQLSKILTREEFMNIFQEENSFCFSYKNIYLYCPHELDLISDIDICMVRKSGDYQSCRKCWENAIKNIKFKGEVI